MSTDIMAIRGTTVLRERTGEWFRVYTPTTSREFQAGHLNSLWYFAEANYFGSRPRSCAYDSLAEAIAAVNVHVSEITV